MNFTRPRDSRKAEARRVPREGIDVTDHECYSGPVVSETDRVQLSRLVTEHDGGPTRGHADTIHELYVDDGELTLPPGRYAVVTPCVLRAR